MATSRIPIAVKPARAVDLTITCQLVASPGADQEAVKNQASAALADPGTGLFSPRRMSIGQRLYRSQVEAALMVSGVSAVLRLRITQASPGDDDPPASARPDEPSLDPGPDGYFGLLPETLTVCVAPHG